MNTTAAVDDEKLNWLKGAFYLQAVLLIATLIVAIYFSIIFLPRQRREAQAQADQIAEKEKELESKQKDLATVYSRLGNYQTHAGRYSDAIASYDEALDLDPNDSVALRLKAEAVFAAGNQAKGLELAGSAAAMGKDPESFITLGRMQCETHDDGAAIKSFKSALEVAPTLKDTLSKREVIRRACSPAVLAAIS
jgi:tetratricopeptide (TPR) repeat protein